MTLTIHWITAEFDVHEELLGLYQVDSIDATTLTSVIKDTFIRMNLSISRLRGQCYERLNHLMLLHVHKERTDALDCRTIFKEFVAASPHRSSIFKVV